MNHQHSDLLQRTDINTLPDGVVTQRWTSLGWDIRHWADGQTGNNNYLSVRVRAALWHILFGELLPTTKNPAGTLWEALPSQPQKDQSKKASALYSINPSSGWRSLSAPAKLMFTVPSTPSWEDMGRKLNSLRARAEEDLGKLLPWKLDRKAFASLDEIFLYAVQLQVDLSVQEAWWYCEHDPGTELFEPIDPESMTTAINSPRDSDYYRASSKSPAAFIITPSLNKRGNSRGERYETHRVVAKSEVVFNLRAPPVIYQRVRDGIQDEIESLAAKYTYTYSKKEIGPTPPGAGSDGACEKPAEDSRVLKYISFVVFLPFRVLGLIHTIITWSF
ncbi:hypothetical protein QBC44DRAFT_383104 [Cladorrhinum sp. PSN332]|nr:hypothetical protein QBC44DRAFT_383104 [Cladorrhinum sp. PSN332]